MNNPARQPHANPAPSARRRQFGLLGLFRGRTDLLQPSPAINSGKGYGRVTSTRVYELGYSERLKIAPSSKHRVKLRIRNIGHLFADGTETGHWEWSAGRWIPASWFYPATGWIVGHFFLGIGRQPATGDRAIQVGETLAIGEGEVTTDDIYVLTPADDALTPDTFKFRIEIEEVFDYGKGE